MRSLWRIIRLSGQQKLPMTKTRIRAVLERLDRLGSGGSGGGAVHTQADDSESKRLARLSELVPQPNTVWLSP